MKKYQIFVSSTYKDLIEERGIRNHKRLKLCSTYFNSIFRAQA